MAGQDLAPLFVVGAPRSGTSLLYKLLCLHPRAAWISNWGRRAPGQPALAALNRLARRLPATRRRAWFGADGANAYVYGHARPLVERLFPSPVEGEPVYRRCGVGSGAAGVPDRQIAELRRSFAAIQQWSGGDLLISKRIHNNLRIPLLAEAFPRARFVHLIRDGRAVAYSLSRVDWWEDGVVWWYGQTPRRWREEGRDPWELCARHWVRELAAVGTGLTAVPAGQRVEVRYEQLVHEPIETVGAIASFAGLGPEPSWTAELPRLRYPDKDDAWRDALAPDARASIERIQRADLRCLGHAV
jgi:hypothetical protein